MTCCSLYVWAAASIEAGHEQATQDVRGTIAPQSSDICDDANSFGDLRLGIRRGDLEPQANACARGLCARDCGLAAGFDDLRSGVPQGGGHD
jgi:hypothetical protein